MKKVHLLCNAHLDPYWLWEWEEGAAEAISTFRVAADFCEEYEGFIFNHNEVILYKWVEQYEPELFARIQRLVREGRWRIMGGTYLQPDCNMPSGESFVRQVLTGKTLQLPVAVVDLQVGKPRVHPEGAGFVGDDRHDPRPDVLVPQQFLEDADHRHGGGHLLASGSGLQRLVGFRPGQRQRRRRRWRRDSRS